jgi:hypothetical protein
VIGIANGERVGQRVVERDIAPRQMRHGRGALLLHPAIVLAGIPCRMSGRPVMRQVLEKLQPEIVGAGAKRQHMTLAMGLIPHRLS